MGYEKDSGPTQGRLAGPYIVEVYTPSGGLAQVLEAEARAAAAAGAMRREGTCVRYLRSLFVPEDETCFHTFAADSIDVVGAAAQRAGLRYVRIVEAVLASEARTSAVVMKPEVGGGPDDRSVTRSP